MNERAAFEQSIDENPLESTTHHAYADWLEENGHHDEAAFRRAMGEWYQNGAELIPPPPDGGDHPYRIGNPVEGTKLPEGVTGFTYRRYHPLDEAEGLTDDNVYDGSRNHVRVPGVTASPSHARWNGRDNNFSWRSRRDMENSFRNSFMRNRKSQESTPLEPDDIDHNLPTKPDRMSRRIAARKMSRRGF